LRAADLIWQLGDPQIRAPEANVSHCSNANQPWIGQFSSTLVRSAVGAARDRAKAGPSATGQLHSVQRADERAAVVARARFRTINAEGTIFALGSPGDQMMALLRGTVRISVRSFGGRELLLAIIRFGGLFGELAVLDGKERSADVMAESPCTLAISDRHDILSFFERNPSAWPKLVKVSCQRYGPPTKSSPKLRCSAASKRLLDLDRTLAARAFVATSLASS
jgi:CRP-like cAMP-binding protein